eukprot:scaffold246132_cov31-Tisochrysis_lutea.AAC.2
MGTIEEGHVLYSLCMAALRRFSHGHSNDKVHECQDAKERCGLKRGHLVHHRERQHQCDPKNSNDFVPCEPGKPGLDGRHGQQRLQDVANGNGVGDQGAKLEDDDRELDEPRVPPAKDLARHVLE